MTTRDTPPELIDAINESQFLGELGDNDEILKALPLNTERNRLFVRRLLKRTGLLHTQVSVKAFEELLSESRKSDLKALAEIFGNEETLRQLDFLTDQAPGSAQALGEKLLQYADSVLSDSSLPESVRNDHDSIVSLVRAAGALDTRGSNLKPALKQFGKKYADLFAGRRHIISDFPPRAQRALFPAWDSSKEFCRRNIGRFGEALRNMIRNQQ